MVCTTCSFPQTHTKHFPDCGMTWQSKSPLPKRRLHWQKLNLPTRALGRDRPAQTRLFFTESEQVWDCEVVTSQCISTEVASECFKSLNMCQCWNIPVVWMTLSTKNVASLPVQPVSDFYGDVRLENRCTGKALKTVTHNEKQLSPFSCEVMGSNTKQILLHHCQFTSRWPMIITQPKQHCLKGLSTLPSPQQCACCHS